MGGWRILEREPVTGESMLGLVSLVAVLIGFGAQAQPPGEVAPETVCLTNACGTPAKSLVAPKTVGDAISAGLAHVVRDLGGTPLQAVAAVDTRARGRVAETNAQDPDLTGYAQAVSRFGDTSDGSTLSFVPASSEAPDRLGLSVVGSIQRRSPTGRVQTMLLLDNGAGRLLE